MTFKHGESGNPNGRPKNSGHRQQIFNALVEPHRETLFKKAIDLALQYDNEAMLKLFLERMLPARPSDEPVTVAAPKVSNGMETIAAFGKVILKEVSQGTITPREGNALMACVEAQRKNIETLELSQRVSEIERTLKQRKKSDTTGKRR